MALKSYWLNINGAKRMCVCDPDKDTLAAVLRRMGLTGTKIGCNGGQCGACSVILNGEVVRSCVKRMRMLKDEDVITTIEGIGTPDNLHPLQEAWNTYGAVQCGFCSPGFIVSAKGLLEANPDPTREEVRAWFAKHHNICRCTGYKPIVDAVMAAATVLSRSSLTVCMTGGLLFGQDLALMGPDTEAGFRGIRAAKTFITADGVRAGLGFLANQPVEAATKKAMVEAGQEVYVVMDSSKLEMTSIYPFSAFEDVDFLITEKEITDPGLAGSLSASGVRVLLPGGGIVQE